MPAETLSGAFVPNNAFMIIVTCVAVLVFAAAYYFIRKSLLPTEDFDNSMLRNLTREDNQESLQYCVSFFQDAYDSKELPDLSVFMELRIRASIVLAFYRNVRRAAYVYSKLRSYYYKDKPLPDYTAKYKDSLKEDGREGDVVGAFCLYGIEEFGRLEEESLH